MPLPLGRNLRHRNENLRLDTLKLDEVLEVRSVNSACAFLQKLLYLARPQKARVDG
jgi:hypothetical protein